VNLSKALDLGVAFSLGFLASSLLFSGLHSARCDALPEPPPLLRPGVDWFGACECGADVVGLEDDVLRWASSHPDECGSSRWSVSHAVVLAGGPR
jgi:hypothetical protein